MLLSLAEFEGCEGGLSGDPWRDLKLLESHLDDHLVRVSRLGTPGRGPSDLAVFRARDEGKTPLYVQVSSDGDVHLGHVDNLDDRLTERLSGFNPLRDGVVSVSVTDRHRFAGRRSDLWIVVRRTDEPQDQIVAYHGVVGLEDGALVLEPALDDRRSGGEGHWEAVDAARLPEWLRAWSFVTAPGNDPFDEPRVLGLLGGVEKIEEAAGGDIEQAAASSTALGIAVGDEVRLWRMGGTSPFSLSTGDWVRALALSGGSREQGVAGPDARVLVGFEADSSSLRVAWRQPTEEFPAAVAFLPQADRGGGAWPDLVVASSNGHLERLRYVGSAAFLRAWERVWTDRLQAATAADRIAVARKTIGDPSEDRRRTAILGAILKVLEEVESASPACRSDWASAIAPLFQPKDRSSMHVHAVRRLLTSLRALVHGERLPWPLVSDRSSYDFVVGLLKMIYDSESYITIQDEIDLELRILRPSKKLLERDHNLAELYRRSQHNRAAVWCEPDPADAKGWARHTVFFLDRWASAYLHADIAQLPPRGEVASVTGLAGLPPVAPLKETASRLVATLGRQLQVLELRHLGTLEGAETALDLGQDTARTALQLPAPSAHRIVVAGASGTVYLLERESDQGVLSRVHQLEIPHAGSPWALAACSALGGAPVVALSFNDRRRSTLIVLTVEGDRLQYLWRYSLDLPRVRAMDLATDGEGGFLLAAGSSEAAPTFLYRFDPLGKARDKMPFRALKSGTLAVRFSSPVRPLHLLVGERTGLLWCAGTSAWSDTSDLLWTYDLGAAVRSIEAVVVRERPCFLAGSEEGRLVLLDAREGRRLWKHRLRAPVRVIRQIDGPGRGMVAVSLRGGFVLTFDRVEGREEVLARVEGYLKRLGSDESMAGRDSTATAEPVQALARLIEGKSILPLLRDVPVREIRVRLVRYVAEVLGPGRLKDEIDEVLQVLTLREIQLLLAYLPDTTRAWDEAILKELRRKEPETGNGDESLRAGMAAWATLLQRLGRIEHSFEDIKKHCPPPVYCELVWVRLEYVHLLVRRVEADLGSSAMPALLLARALEALVELPFPLLAAAVSVVRYGSTAAKGFASFFGLVETVMRGETPHVEDLEELTETLRFAVFREPGLALVAAVVQLWAFQMRSQVTSDQPWLKRRVEALAAIRQVSTVLHAIKRTDIPLGLLADGLRSSLSTDLLPEDSETLQHRSQWLQQTRVRLENRLAPQERDESWQWLAHRLAEIGKEALLWLVNHEIAFVNELVRPYLEFRGMEVGEGRRLELRLSARPEGGRTLSDVSVLFDAQGDEGLLPPGNLSDRLDVLRYPDRAAVKELVFRGQLRLGQDQVVVRVQVQDEHDYRYEERWAFQAPKEIGRVRHRLSFSEQLPEAFRRFVAEVVQAKESVVFAVLDADLGREALIEEWLSRTHGRRINLDESVRDIGPGRRYAARSLDLKLLIDSAEEVDALGATARQPGRPVLLAPVDELVERLLLGEVEGLLEAWLSYLERRGPSGRLPRWVLVVSVEHACRLRSLHEGRITEIAAHRALLSDLGTDRCRPSPLLAEAVAMVTREAELQEYFSLDRIKALGGDLRFVLRWLRWRRDSPERTVLPLAHFLFEPKIRLLLELELKALSASELVKALVGAEAVTTLDLAQVTPGHFAADDHRSTTRSSTPKLLQAKGTAFDDKSLQSLHSDLRPPNRVKIEGLGLLGTVTGGRTALLPLAQYGSRGDREKTLRALAERGIGNYASSVFRTGAPYRELIRFLYEQKATLFEARRDSAVYAAFKGRGRSPLESVSVAAMGSLGLGGLKVLLPDAKKEDLANLRRICRLWLPATDEAREDVEAVFHSAFSGMQVVRVSDAALVPATLAPLAKLPWPVFAVGKKWDEFYIWNENREAGLSIDLKVVGDAAEAAGKMLDREEGLYRALRVTVLGPGVDSEPYDVTRRVALLRIADICQAAWEGDLVEGMRRRIRPQMRLTAFSPFKTSGALPPGSPLFVGRELELAFIKNRVRHASILIIGSRRVGKTSLLNQIDHWAGSERDLAPIFVDLQGCESRADFLRRLRAAANRLGMDFGAADSLEAMVDAIQASRGLPVLLLNEIDGLAKKERGFVSSWRGLNDRGQARFVMVGYSVIGTLGNANAALFHFTEGTALSGKALVLTALSPEAGEKLLDLLESQDLGVRWATSGDREQAYRFCLDRSYRIPWVLQRFGQLLVEHLEAKRRDDLTFSDVERVIEQQGGVVWQYISGIEYESLGGGVTNAQRPGFQLVLTAVARKKYFLGGRNAPIRDPDLSGREGLDKGLGFTVGEAREIVKGTLRELLVKRAERDTVEAWFSNLNLDRAFRLLTLTLMLESDPLQDGRYGFLLHILPRELQRVFGAKDPTLDGLIVAQAIEFFSFMKPH